MPSLIFRAIASTLWLVASAFLATTSAGEHDALRIAAAILVGFPGMVALLHTLGSAFGKPNRLLRQRAKLALQAALVEIYRERLYRGDDVTLVSFHVWVVPTWYRWLVPFSVRRRQKPDSRRLPVWLRPRLQRLAMYRFARHEESGISFRKGVGIIGRCIDLNEPGEVLIVRLDSHEYRKALRRGPDHWHEHPIEITQNLTHRDAARLAETYGQVATVALRTRKGEAFGCVTLDLPPGAPRLKVSTARRRQGDPLLDWLHATAGHLSAQLTS